MIINEFKNGNRGFGDASSTGSGKTLTALGIMCNLFELNENINLNYAVLLPNAQLIKTWNDEINKHTKNFNIVTQRANGKLEKNFKSNNILLTTLGRMRDHPINIKWSLVIIDECLTVQNENALWTEEACRQVINSTYGVLMLSATFFRCKFEKLFFMLKMLQSGFPINKNYLNIILDTSIICNYTEGKIWNTSIIYDKLNDMTMEKYENIKLVTTDFKLQYIKLNNLLLEHDYSDFFINTISKLNKENKKVVLYIDGVQKTNVIFDKIKTKIKISRFPDITENNCITAVSEALYGVNNLTNYDTILSPPIDSDKIPQLKGRLDRPSQKSTILYLYFYAIENTIHTMLLQKMDIATNFYNQYIMPIAKKVK